MKRGEIYYVSRRDELSKGSELMKSRPGIIVSSNALNDTSEVVEVVYLTTAPKRDLPTHVAIHATGMQSTALCEQIDHVSVRLIGDYRGTCTKEEMEAIDRALKASLDLDRTTVKANAEVKAPGSVNHPSHYNSGRIEVIDFIEDQKLGFHLGNAVKYIARAGKKDPAKTAEDLKKAVWYLSREIQREEGAAEG